MTCSHVLGTTQVMLIERQRFAYSNWLPKRMMPERLQ